MGVDEALLDSAAKGQASLRFYNWAGACLSLGYAQAVAPALIADCRAAGVDLVRRVTGGRAVLHGNDLTYCVAAPEAQLPRGKREAYESIGAALLEALLSLGLDAVLAPSLACGAAGAAGFDCFEAVATGEICVAGRKLTGNAQRRAGGALLQHGSIRLTADPDAASRAVRQLPGAATSLAEAGCSAGEPELRAAIGQALAAALKVGLEQGRLSHAERERATARARQHARAPLGRPLRGSRGQFGDR